MKHLRKFTALLAVCALLCALWTPMAVTAAQGEPVQFGRSILKKLDNGEALCFAYDTLAAGLEVHSDYIQLDNSVHRLTNDESWLVWDMVLADNGEYGSLVSSYGISYNSNGVSAFRPYYYDYDIDLYHQQMDARIAELTAGLEGKSDMEKSRILHDRLCEIVTYDMVGYHQSAIGSLLEGKSVCAGYARGYQVLLQAVGIPCFYVSGTADNGFEIGNHAWNLVMLDGQWYYTDVTWDDTDYVFEDGSHWILDTYLNVDYDFISQEHFAGGDDFDLDAYLPKGDEPQVMLGDADGNGKLNNRDLILLQKYINGDDFAGKTFDAHAADIDGNGKINNRDLIQFQKALNN